MGVGPGARIGVDQSGLPSQPVGVDRGHRATGVSHPDQHPGGVVAVAGRRGDVTVVLSHRDGLTVGVAHRRLRLPLGADVDLGPG